MDDLTLESSQVYYACEAVCKAADFILSKQKSGVSVSYKKDGSPVTTVDLESNEIICHLLKKTNIPIISEEIEPPDWKYRSTWKSFWVLDPLDGTAEYIRNSENYSILLSLIFQGVPKIGVVCLPALDRLYVGITGKNLWVSSIKGRGGIKSFKEVFRLPPQSIKSYILLQSSTQQSLEDEIYQRCLKRNFSKVVVKKMTGIFKILSLIEGKAHGYVRFVPSWIWDVAAGHALLQSVGMDLLDLQKKPFRYDNESLQIQGFSSIQI